jgi:hypothetical protein
MEFWAQVGMEFWARWAHRALWHASLWHMHESHDRPREGPFELNDVFSIVNAVPAMFLLVFGFFNRGLVPEQALFLTLTLHFDTFQFPIPLFIPSVVALRRRHRRACGHPSADDNARAARPIRAGGKREGGRRLREREVEEEVEEEEGRRRSPSPLAVVARRLRYWIRTLSPRQDNGSTRKRAHDQKKQITS